MPHKCIPDYWFSKLVYYHLISRNVFQNHFILRDYISDEMISNLDMFGLPMIFHNHLARTHIQTSICVDKDRFPN